MTLPTFKVTQAWCVDCYLSHEHHFVRNQFSAQSANEPAYACVVCGTHVGPKPCKGGLIVVWYTGPVQCSYWTIDGRCVREAGHRGMHRGVQ